MRDELQIKKPYSMPIYYAKISILTGKHGKKRLKIRMIIIGGAGGNDKLKTIRMTFH